MAAPPRSATGNRPSPTTCKTRTAWLSCLEPRESGITCSVGTGIILFVMGLNCCSLNREFVRFLILTCQFVAHSHSQEIHSSHHQSSGHPGAPQNDPEHPSQYYSRWNMYSSHCLCFHKLHQSQDVQEKVTAVAKISTSMHVWIGLRYTCQFNFWVWTSSAPSC